MSKRNNWRQTTLGKVIDLVGGGTPKTTVEEYWNGDIPWLSVVDFNNGNRWVSDTEKKITELGLGNSSTKMLDTGDLIISARGTVGALAQLTRSMAFNQSCYGVRSVQDVTDEDFLYYLMLTTIERLKRNVHGAVFDTITRDTFDQIEVSLPSIQEQKAIAVVLGSLDNKIELLRAQNKTLEEMAQRLFKEWFVDFNFPNEDGKPYKKSGGRMVESEMGEIPEEWRVEKFSNIVDVLSGGTPKTTVSAYWNGSIPFFTPKDVKDTFFVATTEKNITEEGLEHCNSRLYPKETVFITARGTVGKCVLALRDMAMNQSCYALVGKDVSNLLVFLLTKQIIDLIKKSASGAVFDAITVSTFESLHFPMGDQHTVDQYEKLIRPMFSKISDNTNEVSILSELRDQLLPKLMSGEI